MRKLENEKIRELGNLEMRKKRCELELEE